MWKSIAKKKSANLAFLDLSKAYDIFCRETLWKKLSKMGFGRQFLEALKSLYKGDYVTCDANGVSTKPVYLGRGLRQDCYRVLVSLFSWPGQLLSLNPCWRPKILARMLFGGILSLTVVILEITAFLIIDKLILMWLM